MAHCALAKVSLHTVCILQRRSTAHSLERVLFYMEYTLNLGYKYKLWITDCCHCNAAALLAEKAIIKQEALVNSVPLRDLKNMAEALEGLTTQPTGSNT